MKKSKTQKFKEINYKGAIIHVSWGEVLGNWWVGVFENKEDDVPYSERSGLESMELALEEGKRIVDGWISK